MPRPVRLIVTASLLLVGCNDTSSLVQPIFECSMPNGFSVFLKDGVDDVPATIKALAAKHQFQVLRTYIGTAGFDARMTPHTALSVLGEGAVAEIEPFRCSNQPVDIR